MYADDIFVFKPLSSLSDFTLFQTDLNLIISPLNFSHLTQPNVNIMFFSYKHSHCIDSYHSLLIPCSQLERVESFQYLGVLLTPNLSWSPHILKIRQKAHKVLGIIHRHFYKFSTTATILRLYISLVRPILEYCASVWSASLTHSLEYVESFALKITSKFGQVLLLTTSLNFTPLSTHHQHSRLLLLFKIFYSYTLFPAPVPPSVKLPHSQNLFSLQLSTYGIPFLPSSKKSHDLFLFSLAPCLISSCTNHNNLI